MKHRISILLAASMLALTAFQNVSYAQEPEFYLMEDDQLDTIDADRVQDGCRLRDAFQDGKGVA